MCIRQNNIDLLIHSIIWISGMAVLVGSFTPYWLQAEENGSTMSNGLFEKCYQEQSSGILVCEKFMWPNAVNGTAASKVGTILVFSIISAAAVVTNIVISITAIVCCMLHQENVTPTAQRCSRNLTRIAMIICLCGVFVFSVTAGFFAGFMKEIQVFHNSSPGWSFIVYCVGYGCLLPLTLVLKFYCTRNNIAPMGMPFVSQSVQGVATDNAQRSSLNSRPITPPSTERRNPEAPYPLTHYRTRGLSNASPTSLGVSNLSDRGSDSSLRGSSPEISERRNPVSYVSPISKLNFFSETPYRLTCYHNRGPSDASSTTLGVSNPSHCPSESSPESSHSDSPSDSSLRDSNPESSPRDSSPRDSPHSDRVRSPKGCSATDSP